MPLVITCPGTHSGKSDPSVRCPTDKSLPIATSCPIISGGEKAKHVILPASILVLIHPHAAFLAYKTIATAFATVALITQAIRTA
jgi:hypothetical protein